jgi:myo-inositol-1(or 4)-monophosphatase
MNSFLNAAVEAARSAGDLLRASLHQPLKVNAEEAHDIKLELDVQAQDLITGRLLKEFPSHAILGEEGSLGNVDADKEWIIDPIDGTVNFFYGIPHYCISIALRQGGTIELGVIYDPVRDELWHAAKGGPAHLNDRVIRVSTRHTVGEATVSVGFSKENRGFRSGLRTFEHLIHRARKCRMMGSAALDLAYVATGRLDAYIERSVSWWDVAAGVLLVECAGGKVDVSASPVVDGKLAVVASNGLIELAIPEEA